MRRLFCAVLLLSACREGPEPFAIEDAGAPDASGQLTFSLKNDHVPAWNTRTDSLFYSAPTYPGFEPTRGALLMVPRSGGTARPMVPAIQVGLANKPWLAAPAISPDGNSVAFFEITDYRDREYDYIVCDGESQDTIGAQAFLRGAILRVRSATSTTVADAARLVVPIPGPPTNVIPPFHRMFDLDGLPSFRASWSPDGTGLAFSNGSSLFVWTVGDQAAVELAGTTDGVMPAWSPDGAWIAFSRPFRGLTELISCEGWFNGARLPARGWTHAVYTPYTREDAQLALIRPDGSDERALGVGDSPAWTPDSRFVIAHRDANLYKIAIDDGTATLIPNTLNAFEAAVSPDGRYLGFARRTEIGTPQNPKGNYDIWVAPF